MLLHAYFIREVHLFPERMMQVVRQRRSSVFSCKGYTLWFKKSQIHYRISTTMCLSKGQQTNIVRIVSATRHLHTRICQHEPGIPR